MSSNSANIGLLSNSQNKKYNADTNEEGLIELQDIGEEPQYVSMDDANASKPQTAPPPSQNQPQYSQRPQAPPTAQPNQTNAIPQNPQQQARAPQIQTSVIYMNQPQWNPYGNYYGSGTSGGLFNFSLEPIDELIGSTFTTRGPNMPPQRPPNSASCSNCKILQVVNDINQPFMCYSCKQITRPQFKYFQCGVCRITVLYQVGVSLYIRCSRCNTNNYVQQPEIQQQQGQWQQQPIGTQTQASAQAQPQAQAQQFQQTQYQNQRPPQQQAPQQQQQQQQQAAAVPPSKTQVEPID